MGTTQDPATPYEWAKSLSKYILGSHLITLKGEGHNANSRVRLVLMMLLTDI
ncbi:MAG: alpha/beta hydrolase [Betaproteobacteria bacterium]|nr:alpha/beta hydrolase [Betaproteobacteria bacterium]